VAASLVISSGVLYFFNSWIAAIASFLAGVFIDLDHLLDYYLRFGVNFNVKKFYLSASSGQFKKLFILLHSYEIIAILWIMIYIMDLGIIWIAIAIGFTQHLLFDVLVNSHRKIDKLGYFLLYRIKNKFIFEKFRKK